MRILIAPNAFKGTLGPLAAGRAIARALRKLAPGAKFELLPVSDGGDGLLETFLFEHKGRGRRVLSVPGPVSKPVRARWVMAGDTAVIEMAEAAGLKYLSKKELAPLDAATFGVGKLIRAAVAAGARSVIVGLGGSASNDGGAGCAAGFGFRLLDKHGRPVPPGARGLLKLEKIFLPTDAASLARIKIIALTDVDNPLTGPRGSARVYGPQKGAGPADVVVMEKALLHYARVIKRELGIDIKDLKGGAAAGGLGAGLYAFFGARLTGGSDFVLKRLNFEAAVKRCDLVITGEGRFDDQSFSGKAPFMVARLARSYKKPALMVCGSCAVEDLSSLKGCGISGVIALDTVLPLSELLGSPASAMTKGILLSRDIVSRFLQPGKRPRRSGGRPLK